MTAARGPEQRDNVVADGGDAMRSIRAQRKEAKHSRSPERPIFPRHDRKPMRTHTLREERPTVLRKSGDSVRGSAGQRRVKKKTCFLSESAQ